jgi:hypothetical protein
MKSTKSPSRIDTINVMKLEVEPSIAGELALAATVGLIDHGSGPGSLARSLYKGPWPEDVLQLVVKLRDRIEEHLLTIYFEVNEHDRSDTGKSSSSACGIVEPQLGGSSTTTPQL